LVKSAVTFMGWGSAPSSEAPPEPQATKPKQKRHESSRDGVDGMSFFRLLCAGKSGADTDG